jgi:thiamine biosynthesis lipoprotein
VGGLVDAWELRRGGRVPSEAEIRDALVPGGFAALALDAGTAMRAHARLRIEEGGFGKGVGLDAALEALGKAGVQSALLDLGGQFALLGRGERVLAIAHPIERDRPILTVRIDRGSLATSGNGERGIVVDGVRYGHLLDPRTGRPANDFGSVTVWAESASAADCLSTGLFVLGPDRALRFAEEHAGVEVAVVELRPEGPTIRVSRGLEGRIALSRAASAAGVTPYFERRKP